MSTQGLSGGGFNFDTQAGVAHLLASVRSADLSAEQKNDLRDTIFLYINGGRDNTVRLTLEQKLATYGVKPAANAPGASTNDQSKASPMGFTRSAPSSFSVSAAAKPANSPQPAPPPQQPQPAQPTPSPQQAPVQPAPAQTPPATPPPPQPAAQPPAQPAAPTQPNQTQTQTPAATTPPQQPPQPAPAPQPAPVSTPPASTPPPPPKQPAAPAAQPIPTTEPTAPQQPAPAPATQPTTPSVEPPLTGHDPAVFLARIREIKSLVNQQIGNPVNLVDLNNEVGREYMGALLDAMKKINSGASAVSAMQRLEAAYKGVERAIAERDAGQGQVSAPPTPPETPATPPPEPTTPAPAAEPKQPAASAPAAQSVPTPQTPPTPPPTTPTPPAPPTKSGPPPTPAPPPVAPKAEPAPAPTPAKTAPIADTAPPNDQSEPTPEAKTIPLTQAPAAAATPNAATQPTKPPKPPSPTPAADTPSREPASQKPPSPPPTPATPAPAKEKPATSTQPTPKPPTDKKPETDRVPLQDIPNPAAKNKPSDADESRWANDTLPQPGAEVSKVSSLADTLAAGSKKKSAAESSEIKPPTIDDPLYTSEVDEGLDQLLSEWSLFKKSGLFGTGPNGREHPLFKKIAGLQIPLLLAGRFEGATQEIKQSITDYMNGWRYEQGIIYNQGETFERYLRRVIRHILDLQKKKTPA